MKHRLEIIVLTGLSAAMLSSSASLSAQECGEMWEKEFSLTLEECINMASEGNVNVKNSHLDFLSAKMRRREATAHYFPSVDFRAMGFHALNPLVRIGISDILGTSDLANNLKYNLETSAALNGISTTYETLSKAYGAALVLTQPVYAGGRIVNSNRLASLGVKAASLNESIAKRDIVTDIREKYFLAVSLEEKMKVVDQALTLSDSLYKDACSAYSSGLVTESVKEDIIIGRQDLKAKKIRLRGGILLAKMNLCNALGLGCAGAGNLLLADRLESVSPPDSCYKDPAGIVSNLDEARLLDLAVQQKKLEKNLAMGEALPEIGIGASYSYGHLIGSPQHNGMLYATLKIPITDWGKVGNRMKSIDYQMEKAGNRKEYLCSMLELQLRQHWVEVESSWEELLLKDENVAHAKDLLYKTSADVDAGLATQSQLMEKQVALSNAECDRIDALIAYCNALATFRSKAGTAD